MQLFREDKECDLNYYPILKYFLTLLTDKKWYTDLTDCYGFLRFRLSAYTIIPIKNQNTILIYFKSYPNCSSSFKTSIFTMDIELFEKLVGQ